MLSVRNMQRKEVKLLYEIALRAFQPDYERYGVYPPVINLKSKGFSPPRIFGKAILVDDRIIGGAFVAGLGKKGEIGSIFLDTPFQHKGHGRQAMLRIEALYPTVRRWRLDVLADKHGLHRFYESLGYIRVGDMTDKKSGLRGFTYEKTLDSSMAGT